MHRSMAMVLKNQGKVDEALDLYQEALDIQISELGAEHLDVATTKARLRSTITNMLRYRHV